MVRSRLQASALRTFCWSVLKPPARCRPSGRSWGAQGSACKVKYDARLLGIYSVYCRLLG